MAVAIQMLDHRHLGIAAHAFDQAFAAARNDDIDELRHRDQLGNGLPIGGLHQLHCIDRQAGLTQ